MSVSGLGRVKTPTFNLRVEIPSRFRKFENQKCLRPLLREDDRENNSALSWLVHVFATKCTSLCSASNSWNAPVSAHSFKGRGSAPSIKGTTTNIAASFR